jgi:hypothetical protein
MNVCVPCTGGSARPILLECLFKVYDASHLRGYVAGLQPSGWVDPQAGLLLFGQNHDTVNLGFKIIQPADLKGTVKGIGAMS